MKNAAQDRNTRISEGGINTVMRWESAAWEIKENFGNKVTKSKNCKKLRC